MIVNEKDILMTYRDSFWWNAKRAIEICKKRGWVPLNEKSNLLPTLAYIVGKNMGDGHLDYNFTARFSDDNIEDLNKLKRLINEELKIPLNKTNILKIVSWGTSYCLVIYDAVFGRFLRTLGAPQGRKTDTNFGIPYWVYLSKETKKSFLQGILEDELASFRIRNGFPAITNFKMTKKIELKENLINFLKEVKHLLEEFNVGCSEVKETSINRFGKFEALFWIQRNAKNVISFSENIGFKLNTNKIENLNQVVNLSKEIVTRNENRI